VALGVLLLSWGYQPEQVEPVVWTNAHISDKARWKALHGGDWILPQYRGG
jgi:hypothetical protein